MPRAFLLGTNRVVPLDSNGDPSARVGGFDAFPSAERDGSQKARIEASIPFIRASINL